MTKHKDTVGMGIVNDTERKGGIVVGGNQPASGGMRQRLMVLSQDKKKLAVLLTGLILALLGAGYVAARLNTPEETPAASQEVVSDAVNRTSLSPNYSAAEAELNRQLKETRDNKKQAQLYMSLASVAYGQEQYQKVVDYELRASKLDPALADSLAATIADAYAKLGNKTQAIGYYDKALAYYTAQPETYSGRSYFISDMKTKKAELEK